MSKSNGPRKAETYRGAHRATTRTLRRQARLRRRHEAIAEEQAVLAARGPLAFRTKAEPNGEREIARRLRQLGRGA